MKKLYAILFLLFSFLSLHAQNDYYWYKGNKVPLEKNSKKKFILFEDVRDSTELKKVLDNSNIKILKYGKSDLANNLVPYNQKEIKIKNWATVSGISGFDKNFNGLAQIIYESSFYTTKEGAEAGLSHLFYVKIKNKEDLSILEKFAIENKVEIVGQNKFMPLWFTLACSNKSAGDALEMANLFYETQLFAASEPDLIMDIFPACVNDTYFSSQWGLNNTGQNGWTSGIDINFCQARQITSGDDDIVIAVVDQGFDRNHPDLANVSSVSYDTESGTSPSVVYGNHATPIAGIIGATSNNNKGVSGIAPDCRIMSVSINPNSLNGVQCLADGINFAWQNGASVISNSWGISSQFAIIDNAIEDALEKGRGGFGSVVVFAAGNENSSVNYPSNSNDDIIAVGAMSPCGERKSPTSCDGQTSWGSCYGNELDIMAPGVFIPSTDLQGTNGYNTSEGTAGDYFLNFGGTSAACPHVAAIAGLILSEHPNITQKEVSRVIESTAQKVGGYSYQTTSGRPNGPWHEQMGYGLIDAYAALQEDVCETSIVNGTYSTNTTVENCNIIIQNVNVENGAALTIESDTEVLITGEIVVASGSEFVIQ